MGCAKRVDRDRGHDRGIDATRQPDDDIGKAVLLHVIARRDDNRAPDDLADVELDGRTLLHLVDGTRRGIEDEEVLLVDGRGVHEAAVGCRDRGVSGKHDRIGSAALVSAHDMRAAFARKRGEMPQITARRRSRHRVTEGVVVHLDEHVDVGKLAARLEVPIEEHGDVAVRKLDDRDDVAFEQRGCAERLERAGTGEEELGNDGERVGVELVDARARDERGHGRLLREGAEMVMRVLDEGMRVDETADVRAGERTRPEDDEVNVRVRCLPRVIEHLAHVAGQIADTGVYLCNRNAHMPLPWLGTSAPKDTMSAGAARRANISLPAPK